MCNQTVGLIAAAIERRGISTVAIQLLKLIAESVRPPRALLVPFKHGYPLGTPGDTFRQISVIKSALTLIENTSLIPPALEEYSLD
jgi:hypothetical protein